MIDSTTEAIFIKLTSILNNLDIIEDTAEKIHRKNKSWFVKMKEDAEREKREKKSQKYRSHS